MAKRNNNSTETITNLPPTGETGAGVPEYGRPDTTGGNFKPPQYKDESFFQKIIDNWVLIAFIFGLFWGFVTQVWTPLVELKQRVGVLEKTVDKHDTLLEQLRNNLYQNSQRPQNLPVSSPAQDQQPQQ